MEYRVENKYLCTDYEMAILKQRVEQLLPTDRNQKGECYSIRSVYFDTYGDECFYGNAEGVDRRNKYRIRIYDNSARKIHFEIKQKQNGYIRKESFELQQEECEKLLEGKTLDVTVQNDSVRNRVMLQQQLKMLRPVLIVDYERSAYICSIGNVRITFDRNIAASTSVRDFFEKKIPMIPVLQPHVHLLEVKYDEVLPDYIAQALNLGNLQQISFSKYYLGRQVVDTNNLLVY